MLRRTIRLMCTFVFFAATAHAQIATVSTKVAEPFDTKQPITQLDALTMAYNVGDWPGLQTAAVALINNVAQAATTEPVKAALNPRKHYIALTWVGRGPFAEALVMRFIVHTPAPELFSPDLPGLSESSSAGFFELLLTKTTEGESISVYTSTRQNDPFLEGLPAFIQAVVNPLFATFNALAGKVGVRESATPTAPTLTATVKRVGLPFKRAQVALKATVRDPWFDAPAFKRGLDPLEARLKFEDVPNSACGRVFVTQVVEKLSKEMDSPSSQCAKGSFGKCQQALDAVLREALKAPENPPAPEKPCEAAALTALDTKFRTHIKGAAPSAVEQQLTFKNRPPTRFAFGSGAAVMLSANLTKPRVKLQDGLLRADPLDRVLSTAYVNVSPRGYNPDSAKMSIDERIRPYFGAALTPDFGLVFGANLMIVRGIGVTGGVAVLFAKGARQDEIGKAPVDTTDPFRLSIAKAPYLGITYNYR